MRLDASHSITAGMPKIGVLPEVRIDPVTQIAAGKPLNICELHMATHVGTHIDAPYHAFEDGRTIDELPLDRFSGPGVVIPVRLGAGEEISPDAIEAAGLEVERGDIVLLSTGWAARFHDESYHDHPYPSADLARWLVERGVKMLGVDCVTVDAPPSRRGPDFAYPVHRTLLRSEVLIIENLAALTAAEGRRVVVTAFPLKVHRGDAGHARVVVEWEEP